MTLVANVSARPRDRTPLSVVGVVLGVMVKLWFRRARSRLPYGSAWVVLGMLIGGITALWIWVVPTVVDLLEGIGSGDERVLEAILPVIVITLALNVALVQTLLFSFNHVSTDVLLIIEGAPLGKITRSALYVLPEAIALAIISLGLGSIALVSFALADGSFDVSSAIVLTLFVVLAIGAVTNVLSTGVNILLQDLLLARLLATVAVLAALTVLSYATARAIQSPEGLAVLSALGGWLRGATAPSLMGVCLVGGIAFLWMWLASATMQSRRAFHVSRREALVKASTYGLVGASASSYLREPTNISGLLGLLGVAAMTFALGSWFGTDVALALLLSCAVMGITFSVVMAYGDYLMLRWRIIASPASRSSACLQWIIGHLVAGVGVVCVTMIVLLGVWRWVFGDFSMDVLVTAMVASFCGIAGGVLGGWLVPYEKDDMVGVLMTGSVTAVLSGGFFYVSSLFTNGPIGQLGVVILAGGLSIGFVCLRDSSRVGMK